MKKRLSTAIALSLAFLFQSAFAFDMYYPTATPHMISKDNMVSNPANPYIGMQNTASAYYGFLSLYESSNIDDLNGDVVSLYGDVPLGEDFSMFGEESVLSFGYSESKAKVKSFGEEYDKNQTTMAMQFSSMFGERMKGSFRLRMESAENEEEKADYVEFDLGLNYALENQCDIGLHISPKGDSMSKDVMQVGIGCLIGPLLSVGADVSQITKGDKDSETGLVLSADYLVLPDMDLEVVVNYFKNERNLRLSCSYMLQDFVLRASFVALNEKHADEITSTIHGLLMGVSGYF